MTVIRKLEPAYQIGKETIKGKECLVLFNGRNFERLTLEYTKEFLELLFSTFINLNDVNEFVDQENMKLDEKENLELSALKNDTIPVSVHGFVYVIKCNRTKLYKIGKTTNIRNRLKQLKNANPDISLTFKFSVRDMAIESKIHDIFSGKHINGEWFQLDSVDLNSIKYHVNRLNNEV